MENKCAFDLEDRCSALSEMRCESCTFRKTKEQLEAGRRKAKQILNEKYDYPELNALFGKYYSGRKSDM